MRQLASIQVIDKVAPIPDADNIEVVSILGWKVVVKKGEFKVGDKCVYFEIDSLLPNKVWSAFLFEKAKKLYNEKYRLRTVKLRGQISQGLAVPIVYIFPATQDEKQIGDDVTEELDIEKYEPEIPAQLGGDVNAFIWPISKTDEDRIQSNPRKYINLFKRKKLNVTIKLDGTSASYILMRNKDTDEIEYHVCSRNMSLKDGGNVYWEMERKYNILKMLEAIYTTTGNFMAVQGEICGPGIQGNPLGLTEPDLFIFNVVVVETNERLEPEIASLVLKATAERVGLEPLKEVPKVPVDWIFEGNGDPRDEEQYKEYIQNTVDMLLGAVDKEYKDFGFPNSKKPIEGMVFRTFVLNDEQDGGELLSFKVINNNYLLKEKD